MFDLNVFSSAKTFFGEWNDSKKFFLPFFLIILLVLFSLIWIKVAIPTIAYQADIFAWFLIFGLIVAAIDFLNERNALFGFVFVGDSLKGIAVAIVAGGVIAFFLNVTNFAVVSTPFSSIQVSASMAAFIFSVIFAPIVEEFAFRMALYPTCIGLLRDSLGDFRAGLLSMIIVSLAFAFFHFAVFNASISFMFAAFLFSIVAIVGNRFFQSSTFSWALHITNNFIVFGGFPALMLLFR